LRNFEISVAIFLIMVYDIDSSRENKNKSLEEEIKMTLFQMNQKRERTEKQMYKEISKGNFDKADKLRKKLVDLDVQILAAKMA